MNNHTQKQTLNGAKFQCFQSHALAILRIITVFLFLQHGTAKFFGIPYVEGMSGNVELFSMYGLAGVLEIIGGLLILFGLFTRVSAFILSGEAAAAYFIGHASSETFLTPILNGGESAILFSFIFIYIFIAGAGSFAIDNLRSKKY